MPIRFNGSWKETSVLFLPLFNKTPTHIPYVRTHCRAPHAPPRAPNITPAHYAGGAMLGRRGSRLAPPRHRRGAWLCSPAPSPRVPSHAPHSCPVAVGRDVPIAPPRRGAVRGFASRPRRASRPSPPDRPWRLATARAPRPSRAPSKPSKSDAVAHIWWRDLCVPIHPVPLLFMLLCVKSRVCQLSN